MKYQIAWRRKNTTFLHFSPKVFLDRAEAEELAEGLSLEHDKFEHGVQECDDDGKHIGDVKFYGEEEKSPCLETRLTGDVVKPDETVSLTEDMGTGAILDPQQRLEQEAPKEPPDTCREQTDTGTSSPSCAP